MTYKVLKKRHTVLPKSQIHLFCIFLLTSENKIICVGLALKSKIISRRPQKNTIKAMKHSVTNITHRYKKTKSDRRKVDMIKNAVRNNLANILNIKFAYLA